MSNRKTLSNITDPLSIHKAIEEFDRIGRKKFLSKYGFGSRANYFILHNGKHYESKAIVGVAHKFARPDLGPLPHSRFSGGRNRVIVLLDKLGFKSVTKSDKEIHPLPFFRAGCWQYSRVEIAIPFCDLLPSKCVLFQKSNN